MLWRILSAVVVLFWAVMTGLLIRDSYFPDQSRFAEVPPKFVFDLFLTHASALNNNLHLYHGSEKIGHTSFSVRRDGDDGEGDPAPEPVYAVLASGSLNLPADGEQTNDLHYRLSSELLDAEKWKSFDLEIKAPGSDLLATISWIDGQKMPAVEVKKAGQVVMNSGFLQTLLALKNPLGEGKGWLSGLPQLPENAPPPVFAAREGLMDLAGKQRRCYVVSLQMMQVGEMRLLFTEAGELARIELPQDYRFVEPMMHGLEKGINTLE